MTGRVSRVLMTADSVGGVWTYAIDLAAALGRRGLRVLLAALGPSPTAAQRRQAAAVPGLELIELPGRLEWMADAEADLERQGRDLLKLERRFRPDVVQVNGYAHGALPWSSPTVVVAHSCVWSWWRAVRGGDPPAEWDGYRARVRRGLDAAGLVVAPSKAFLLEVQHLYRPRPAAVVVHNGRDLGLFAPAARKEPFVLGAGRLWDDSKNLAAVTAIAGDLPWPVHVAGALVGPDGTVREAGAAHALGHLDPPHLAEWMGRAAVFAAPARYEPFGLTALEAALSGCALVLGDIPTQREIWADAAVFVPPDDLAALRREIEALIADADRRAMLAERARVRAHSFSAEAMAHGYRSVYELAVGNAARVQAVAR